MILCLLRCCLLSLCRRMWCEEAEQYNSQNCQTWNNRQFVWLQLAWVDVEIYFMLPWYCVTELASYFRWPYMGRATWCESWTWFTWCTIETDMRTNCKRDEKTLLFLLKQIAFAGNICVFVSTIVQHMHRQIIIFHGRIPLKQASCQFQSALSHQSFFREIKSENLLRTNSKQLIIFYTCWARWRRKTGRVRIFFSECTYFANLCAQDFWCHSNWIPPPNLCHIVTQSSSSSAVSGFH